MRSGHVPTSRAVLAALASTAAIGAAFAAPAGAQSDPGALARKLGPGVTASLHEATGKIRFVGATPGKPIAAQAAATRSAAPQTSARAFMRAYGDAFGVRD